MRVRPPVVLVLGVVAIHLSTLGVLASPGLLGRAVPDLRRGGHVRLTLVNPAPARGPSPDVAPGREGTLRVSAKGSSSTTHDGERPPRPDAPAARADSAVVYRAQAALDAPVRPRSVPDLSALDGVSWSGLPLRIRLFIDASGAVVDLQVLQSAEQDAVVQRVRQMFLATGFTPAMEHGIAVPCYKDIEMNAARVP